MKYDFGNFITEAHQHPNGGGWVAETAFVEDTCYVGLYASVFGNAIVTGNAKINNEAKIYGNAKISDNAKVYGKAEVFDNSKVLKEARVNGNAKVYENAIVTDFSNVHDDAEAFGNVVLKNFTEVFENAKVYGDFQTEKFTKIFNHCVATRQPTIISGIGTNIIFTDHHISIGCITLPPSAWLKYGVKIGKVQEFRFGGSHSSTLNENHIKIIYDIAKYGHLCVERQEDLDNVDEIISMIFNGDTQDKIYQRVSSTIAEKRKRLSYA